MPMILDRPLPSRLGTEVSWRLWMSRMCLPVSQQPPVSVHMISAWAAVVASKVAAANSIDFMYYFLLIFRDQPPRKMQRRRAKVLILWFFRVTLSVSRSNACSMKPKICLSKPKICPLGPRLEWRCKNRKPHLGGDQGGAKALGGVGGDCP